MAETALRTTFREKLTAHYGRRAKYQRIEAPSSGGGIPDAIVIVRDDDESSGLTAVIEFKEVDELPKRPDSPVRIKFKPGQSTWLTEWARLGGCSILIVKIQSERLWMVFHDEFKDIEAGVCFDDLSRMCHWQGTTLDVTKIWPKF